MRINEYSTLEEFTKEYIGIWNPSEGHWFCLDFKYNGVVYRLNTGSMYQQMNTILPDGREALFGIYQLCDSTDTVCNYKLLEEYADMNALLSSTVIDNRMFSEVIMDDSTEILGKD